MKAFNYDNGMYLNCNVWENRAIFAINTCGKSFDGEGNGYGTQVSGILELKLSTIREGIFAVIERAVRLTLRRLNKPLLFASALKISGLVPINLFAGFAKIIWV